MLCVAYNKKNNLILSDLPIPEINNDEALLKVNICGVCGSDLVKIKKNLVTEGTVLGHEIVGTIEKTGHHIKNWNKGQKVVVAHHVPCLACHFCKSGNFSMCKQFKETNIFPGGFSEYIKLSKAHLEQTTFLIPKGTVSDYEIAFTEPLACCIRAVEKAEVVTSDVVLISGLGSIGNLLGKLCIKKGAHTIGIDLNEERINLSKEIQSIHEGFIPSSESLIRRLNEKTDERGADIIFLASGSEKALKDAMKLVRSGGKIVIFSSIPLKRGFDNNEIYYRELSVIGCYSPSPKSLKDAYQMIITERIKLKKLITNIVKLKDLPEEINKCFDNKALKMMVEI